ncbi:MAG: hypothetical protein ACM359_16235, partial [Bacillota bacterium]
DRLEISINGESYSTPLSDLPRIQIWGGQAEDQLILDCSDGSPVPAGNVSFDGGQGSNVLTFISTSSHDTLAVGSSQIHLGSSIVAYVNAAVSLDAANEEVVNLASLSLEEMAKVSLARGGREVLKLSQLTIGRDATLDLADNALIVSAAPEARQQALAALSVAIQSARAAGDWSGSGLSSSTAKANKQTGLSILLNDRAGQAILTSFAGQPVTENDILVKHTWNGDVTLDGKVDGDDYFLVDSGFIGQLREYRNGDLNFDGVVDGDDYFLIDSAFIMQSGTLAAEEVPAATEASAMLKVAMAPRPQPTPSVLAQLFRANPVL